MVEHAQRRAPGLLLLVVLGGLLLGGLAAVPGAAPADAAAPTRSIAVSGPGVTGMSPAFDPAVTRYSVYTADGEDGSLTVTAGTGDPHGVVQVDGVPVTGPTTVSGLHEGDEVSVIVSDATGTTGYALVYLPPDFPHLAAVVDRRGAAAGDVLLGLGKWLTPSRFFEVAVDRNGVPAYLHADAQGTQSLDLKTAPHGHYTVFRAPTAESGRTGSDLVELDAQFRPVRSMTVAAPLTNTDNHDAILRPDGSRILVGYEPRAGTCTGTNGGPDDQIQDATIQEVSPEGEVVYTWNSADHLDPATETTMPTDQCDYAHINSVQELDNGDILASFRHLSSVYRIAWRAHDGFDRGEVEWRLGGRHSDFTFPSGDSGPCAQHSARMLANGDVLLFDNGSGLPPFLCVDPDDPTGPSVRRVPTRITEYALDLAAGTAEPVFNYQDPDRTSLFAGSAQRLDNGDTLIGWAAEQAAVATEVDASGQVVWELRDTATQKSTRMFTYRAEKAVVPDATPPVVTLGLAERAVVDAGRTVDPGVRCTDLGGSTLQRCAVVPASLDTTTPGLHSYRVEAVDGAGNRTVVSRSYVVRAGRPALSALAAGSWTERAVLRLPKRGARRSVPVRVSNTGNVTDAVTLRAGRPGLAYRVRYRYAGHDVTRSVVAGRWRVRLAPGEAVTLRAILRRVRAVAPRRRMLTLTATSGATSGSYDTLAVVLRGRR